MAKKTDKNAQEYLSEIARCFPTPGMREYFRKNYSSSIRISNGGLVVFEKQKIKTNFCFGYSLSSYDTKDFDRANKMADFASRNEEYFLKKNLEHLDAEIRMLESGVYDDFRGRIYLNIEQVSYGETPTNIYRYFIDDYWTNFRRLEYPRENTEMFEANEQDKAAILAAVKSERAKFEKRLKTYLKRYGTTKLRTWSYWADE